MLQCICSLVVALAMGHLDSPLTVKVDGKTIRFPNEQPHSVAGRTMVPMRGIFEAIGAYVEWDPTQRKVTCRRANSEVVLTIGGRIARKDGAEIEIDAPPRIMHGTTMVPLRFIAESLGAKVDFDAGNNIVEITTEQP